MKHRRFEVVLKEALKNPALKKEWDATEAQYRLVETIIEARLSNKLTQAELASKAGLKQSVLARVESGSVMPSLATVSKIATALGRQLEISFA